MKRFVVLGVLIIAGVIAAWLATRESRELTMQKISDNLFVIVGDGGNTAVFIRSEGVVLVDTKSENSGQAILNLVRSVTDKPITHILNTHTHNDHVGGNHFFAQNVEIVAHENTAGQMIAMDEFRDPARTHGLPDRTFKDQLTLFSGDEAIDLRYFGPAHTNGDAFIVFRALGVMHAGDTFPGMNVVAGTGGSADEYPTTMARAAAEITGVHTVIPGHGEIATWQAFIDNVESIGRRN